MDKTLTVIGYHGTLLTHATAILENGFKPSRNPWDWFGDGIYFWQDAPLRAREWAMEWAARGNDREGQKTAILRAQLDLKNCIDMLDVGWRDVLTDLTREFLALVQSSTEFSELKNHREGPRKGRHELDAAFFNYAIKQLTAQGMTVSSIRAAITEGEPLLPDSPLCYKSHVQICILDPSLIRDVKLI